jgi:hypothetical protein
VIGTIAILNVPPYLAELGLPVEAAEVGASEIEGGEVLAEIEVDADMDVPQDAVPIIIVSITSRHKIPFNVHTSSTTRN